MHEHGVERERVPLRICSRLLVKGRPAARAALSRCVSDQEGIGARRLALPQGKKSRPRPGLKVRLN
jgi:hypothetical protein